MPRDEAAQDRSCRCGVCFGNPVEECVDSPFHLNAVVLGDVSDAMIKEWVIEPFHRYVDIGLRIIAHAMCSKAKHHFLPVHVKQSFADRLIL